jgi:hypothetical protein
VQNLSLPQLSVEWLEWNWIYASSEMDLLGPHGLDEASDLLPITDEEAPRHGRQLHQFSIFMQKGCKDAIHIIRFFRFLFSRSQ